MIVSGWKRKTPPKVITIAGSDSGGGAGIEADLKTFSALGVHGMVAVTSITAQNTVGVTAIHDIPADVVADQIYAVAEDIGIDSGKTGMLSNSRIIEAVSKAVEKLSFPLVVDPVMVAKSGARLLREDAVEALEKKLLPLALVVTPNRMEAEVLWGRPIKSLDDAEKAAHYISRVYGTPNVIVKGGHINGNLAVDVLLTERGVSRLEYPRIYNACTHGTGCSYSAAIASMIGWGYSVEDAVKIAKKFIHNAIMYGLRIGRGSCPVNPTAWLEREALKKEVLDNLRRGAKLMYKRSSVLSPYAPEVQINLVMSLPYWYAKGIEDVAGFPGRIVNVGGKLRPSSPPSFGASKHMARAVLTMMEYDPSIRAGFNLHYDERFVEKAVMEGYLVSYFDRREEPPEIREREGATTPWGIRKAIERIGGKPPDIIVDKGGFGKEPLMFIFGETAIDAVKKAVKIAYAALR